ncbi:MAG TPA: peptidoglycan editing factor PgeF [Trichocoleus sp.]|jgi:YfiH family protein
MHRWQWQSWQGLPYLTCSLLQDWSHGFFTQQFRLHAPEDLAQVLRPSAQVYRVKQVHGNTVLSASQIASEAASVGELSFPEADGILTENTAQAVWVCTADCTPVLIADTQTGQVAAVHAGWRGTATEIVPRAIDRLQEQGSQLKNLLVALGPAITGEVYQVSEAVAAQIGSTVVPQPSESQVALPEEAPVLEALRQLPDSPLLPDSLPGHARIDVRRVIALQLAKMGLDEAQVSIAPYCTYQNPEYFFSYRRERQKKVQWSGIVSA